MKDASKDRPVTKKHEWVWFIYIPEEGDWPIRYWGDDPKVARKIYLEWAGRKRLPAGSKIWRM